MRLPARPPLGLAMALLAGSCVSSDSSTGVGDAASPAGVFVQPAVIPSAADASALPINRIRAVTARWSSNVVLDDTTFVVDPAAAQWEISIGVQLLESPVTARVFLHLINDDGSGSQATQYSGVTDTLTLARDATAEPADVPLVRGPLANLSVTEVEITGPGTVVVAKTGELTADVTVTGSAEPTLYWTSLDESVLTIDGSTATGVAVGLVDVVATAGAVSDTATVEVVVPPVDSVAVNPTSVDIVLGQRAQLGVTVLDEDDAVLTGRQVTWASLDETVATVDQTGEVTAVGLGTTEITATSEGVTGSATVRVVPVPVDSVLVSPDSADVVEGATLTYSVELFDSTGAVLSGRTVTWSTGDAGVATVDQAGVVTGVAVGATTVSATSEGISDDAIVTVSSASPTNLNRWTGLGDGTSWSDPANWSRDAIPTSTDSAVIQLDGTYTVTLDVTAEVSSLVVGATSGTQTFDHSANTLIITGSGLVGPNAVYALAATGDLTGAAGIAVEGLLAWSGGFLSGTGITTIAETGALDISGTDGKTLLGRDLEISGLATWTGTGNLEHDGGPLVNVTSTGTLDIRGDGSMVPLSTTPATLENTGSIQRTVSTQGIFLSNVTLNNSGTVDVQTGALAWTDVTASGISDGSFLISDGGFLALGSGQLTSSSSVTGGGTLSAFDTSGLVDVAGTVQVDTLGLSADSVDVAFSGSYLATSTVMVSAGGSLTLSTPDSAVTNDLFLGAGELGGTAPVVARDSLFWSDVVLSGTGTLVVETGSSAEVANLAALPSTKPILVKGSLNVLAGTLDQDAPFTLESTGSLLGDGILDLADATLGGWLGETSPGSTSPGQLGVVAPPGGLPADPGSIIRIDLEGTTPGTDFDVLDFSGDVTFGGDLIVDTVFGGFVPAPGDTFPVITVDGARTGVFANVTVPTFNGFTLDTVWASGLSADTLYLVANGHPLVFSSDRAGNGSLDIWTQSAGGSSASRLTSSSLDDVSARWSPDGRQVAFYRSDGVTALIFTMDADGSNLTQLSLDQSNHRDPDWSPSGDTIVFTFNDGAQEEIWLMLRDGTGPTPVTDAPNSNEFDPTVSPDGTRILYVTDIQVTSEDIWVADFPSGANATEVTTSNFDEGDPEWSPDGTQMVFVRNVNGNEDLFLFDFNSGAETQLTTDPAQDWLPVFSPAGDQIYWMSDRSGTLDVWVMDITDPNNPGPPIQLTNEPGVDGAPDVRR